MKELKRLFESDPLFTTMLSFDVLSLTFSIIAILNIYLTAHIPLTLFKTIYDITIKGAITCVLVALVLWIFYFISEGLPIIKKYFENIL